jgi:Icc-related predicted phosphoesterase
MGLGDADDRCHQGFAAFHPLIEKLSPSLMLHGHIHPYGQARPDRLLGRTRIVNCIPHRLIELP